MSSIPLRAVAIVLAVGCALAAFAPAADARVTRIVIDSKPSPAYDGKSFGRAGPYERITGRALGEIDPRDPRNAVINDLDLAPRNARGLVEYEATFTLWQPADPATGSSSTGATSSSQAAGRATSAGGRGPRRSPFRWRRTVTGRASPARSSPDSVTCRRVRPRSPRRTPRPAWTRAGPP